MKWSKKNVVMFAFIVITKTIIAQENLDSLLDNWHLDASKCRFDNYFSFMDQSFVFLGTAPGERWNKEAFATFSKPYFDMGKAWDFKSFNRYWSFSEDMRTAWFDEDLETWMRGCRGSGVLLKKNGQWKIVQYNLTVLIENEKMKEFILLRDAK